MRIPATVANISSDATTLAPRSGRPVEWPKIRKTTPANHIKEIRKVLSASHHKYGLQDSPTAMGDIIAKAPGFIISLKDADATIATQRP